MSSMDLSGLCLDNRDNGKLLELMGILEDVSDWEVDFILDIAEKDYGLLSERQLDTIEQIYDKYLE